MGCPRQKLSSISLLSGLCGPALFFLNLYQHVRDLEGQLTMLTGFVNAILCLVEFVIIYSPMMVFTIMIFVYGSLIGILQSLNSQIAVQNQFSLKLTIKVST